MSLLVGICGGTGSGKTTLATKLVDGLRQRSGRDGATMLSFDAYYHDQGHLTPAERAAVNYDHPDSLDGELLHQHLESLAAGREAAVPVYDFTTHTRTADVDIVEPAEVVVVEGILLFAFPDVVRRLDLRVFRCCPEEVRFARRRTRDRVERGRSPASIEAQLEATVRPMHDRFVEPHIADADLVTNHGEDLDEVTTGLVDHVSRLVTAPTRP